MEADYETTPPGDPGLLFDDHGPPDHVCSCGAKTYKVEDDEDYSGDEPVPEMPTNRWVVLELRLLREAVEHLKRSIASNYGAAPPDVSGLTFDSWPEVEPRPTLWQRLKARWIEWRDGDLDAGPTGNKRCRRDVLSGRQFVGKKYVVEEEEG